MTNPSRAAARCEGSQRIATQSGNRIARRNRRRVRSEKVLRKRATSNSVAAVGKFSLPADLPAGKARFIHPMKPRLLENPPADNEWIYELKFDGIRLIAVKNGAKVNLLSRNQNELAARFPEVADAIRALPVDDCVIDGEVVALDDEGRSSFQLL